MSTANTIDRLGVHDSVSAVFPPDVLVEFLRAQELPTEIDSIDDAGIGDCDGVVTFEHREAFLDVDWVHTIQAGYDKFPLEAFDAADVTLTNSTGIHDRTIGETVAGYLLAFSRRLHRHVANQTDRTWRQPAWDDAFTLAGRRLCVVGTGTLGRGIADVAGDLGLEVVGVRRSGDPVPGFERVYPVDDLHEAIADVDFVAVAVPLTDETRHQFGAPEFEAMDAETRFVNVGRGPVVDQDALIEALQAGEIAGAALDVFETEPLPEDSPLWDFDEVIVTPHAGAFTRDYYRDVGEIVATNVERLAGGEPLTNRVN